MPYKDKAKHTEYMRLWKRNKREEQKKWVFEKLGNCCQNCKIEDERVLTIDHIIPIRRKSKVDSMNAGSNLRHRLFHGKIDITDVQLLCANCHMIKTLEYLKSLKIYR